MWHANIRMAALLYGQQVFYNKINSIRNLAFFVKLIFFVMISTKSNCFGGDFPANSWFLLLYSVCRLWRLNDEHYKCTSIGEAVAECEINPGWALISCCCVKCGVWGVSKAVLLTSRSAEAAEPLSEDGTLLGLDQRNGRQRVWKWGGYWELGTGQFCGIVFFLTQR